MSRLAVGVLVALVSCVAAVPLLHADIRSPELRNPDRPKPKRMTGKLELVLAGKPVSLSAFVSATGKQSKDAASVFLTGANKAGEGSATFWFHAKSLKPGRYTLVQDPPDGPHANLTPVSTDAAGIKPGKLATGELIIDKFDTDPRTGKILLFAGKFSGKLTGTDDKPMDATMEFLVDKRR